MDDELQRLINSPFWDSIQRLQKQTNYAAMAFQESESMRAFKEISDSTRLASLALSQSEFMKSARLATESSRLASLAFQESEALQSIRKFTDSNNFATLALRESEAMNSLIAATRSVQFPSLAFQQPALAEQLRKSAEESQLASIALSQSEAFKKLAQFQDLASFKALANLSNSPYSDISLFDLAKQANLEYDADESLTEIDSEIWDEISSQTDFKALSERTKEILLYLYHFYFLPVLLSCLSAYIVANAVEAKKGLESVSTAAEVKKFVRSSHANFDPSVLNGFRVTIADSLNFRDAPRMQSEVIATLPVGTLVEVIDKSNRSWLLVEVEIDGELEEGWISRRYTAHFK
jgi:hypothetical protein